MTIEIATVNLRFTVSADKRSRGTSFNQNMIKVSINLDKIDRSLIYQGKKGKYLNLVLWENRDGRDHYDNDGTVKQDTTIEQRAAGAGKEIVGNWKHAGSGFKKPAERVKTETPPKTYDEDDIPF